MNKFLFKSSNADFQKLYTILETIQKNVLYLTYESNKTLKIVKTIQSDKDLQKQVDAYFEDGETSPQTDNGDKVTEENRAFID